MMGVAGHSRPEAETVEGSGAVLTFSHPEKTRPCPAAVADQAEGLLARGSSKWFFSWERQKGEVALDPGCFEVIVDSHTNAAPMHTYDKSWEPCVAKVLRGHLLCSTRRQATTLSAEIGSLDRLS